MLIFSLLSASGQNHRITIIDLYGTGNINPDLIRAALPVKLNDTLTEGFQPERIIEKLKAVPGMKKAWVAPVCCDDSAHGWMLYIGVKSDTLPDFIYRPTPKGNQQLGTTVMADYTRFNELISEAVLKGEGNEDDSKGHAFLTYPPAKEIQERFLKIASGQLPLLREVLRNAADPAQREAAAWIIPFAASKRSIIPDLLSAAHDENEAVRNNAVRALAVLGKYAADNPSAGIVIPGTDFIAMIRSIVWTDRNKGLAVLEALTKKRDPYLLKLLKEQALDDLIEMALWQNESHAGYAFLILGRMAGTADEYIFSRLGHGYGGRKEQVINWTEMIRAKK